MPFRPLLLPYPVIRHLDKSTLKMTAFVDTSFFCLSHFQVSIGDGSGGNGSRVGGVEKVIYTPGIGGGYGPPGPPVGFIFVYIIITHHERRSRRPPLSA